MKSVSAFVILVELLHEYFCMFKRIFVFVFLPSLLFSCTNSNFSVEVVFTPCLANTAASLRGLHVVSEKVIWASGSEGTVLLSVDGGKTWEVNKIDGSVKNDFRSIHAWDDKSALVFGVSGPDFGYKTNNGEKSWNVVFRDTTSGLFFNSLKFSDSKNGLAVSDPVNQKFYVIKTTNGGETWSRVTNLPNIREGEANFAASNTCIEFLPSGKAWIVSGGSAARVFYADDFGNSWKVTQSPLVAGNPSSGIFSVSFSDNKHGVIVGGTYDNPTWNKNIAAYTTDGGKTWLLPDTMPKEYRSCVQYVPGKNDFFFAVGKTGCDFSLNGITWNFADSTGFYTFRPVQGKREGFVAGADGKIAQVKFKIVK